MNTEKTIWKQCIENLEHELDEQDLNTWIRPLQALEQDNRLLLLAPNQFVLDWVKDRHLATIKRVLSRLDPENRIQLLLEIGSNRQQKPDVDKPADKEIDKGPYGSHLNPDFTFTNFVEGKSNQLARAACMQVAQNPGSTDSNPLFMYGGTGLGKTHLMHAVGNFMNKEHHKARIVYMHAEQFVAHMVRALQHNAINNFKQYYRSLDALLVDDIQFFAGKERSQEEFFYNFNTLLENKKQIILTSDRYPKEVSGLDNRLQSRFGWGLTVSINPPELETRVAILKSKAQQSNIHLPDDVAFFIAKGIRSNVRELEGALRRVYANSRFTGQEITLTFAKEALRDLMSIHAKTVSIDNIQKTVAEYYNLKINDLLSSSRLRTISRPRQIAMALSKELTNHSLPEIGEAFGGRDHTTVLHACRKIKSLQENDSTIRNEYTGLKTMLTS